MVTLEQIDKYDSLLDSLMAGDIPEEKVDEWLDSQGNGDEIVNAYINSLLG